MGIEQPPFSFGAQVNPQAFEAAKTERMAADQVAKEKEQREKFEAIAVGSIVSYKNSAGDFVSDQTYAVLEKHPGDMTVTVGPADAGTNPFTYGGGRISMDQIIDYYVPIKD